MVKGFPSFSRDLTSFSSYYIHHRAYNNPVEKVVPPGSSTPPKMCLGIVFLKEPNFLASGTKPRPICTTQHKG